jgi:hypothetical protein
VDRCRAEIAATESLLLAGHPDVEGLCMALADWSAELRILERELQDGACTGDVIVRRWEATLASRSRHEQMTQQ